MAFAWGCGMGYLNGIGFYFHDFPNIKFEPLEEENFMYMLSGGFWWISGGKYFELFFYAAW